MRVGKSRTLRTANWAKNLDPTGIPEELDIFQESFGIEKPLQWGFLQLLGNQGDIPEIQTIARELGREISGLIVKLRRQLRPDVVGEGRHRPILPRARATFFSQRAYTRVIMIRNPISFRQRLESLRGSNIDLDLRRFDAPLAAIDALADLSLIHI